MSISRKQRKFLEEYLKDFNAGQAYIRAGYSENGAYASSSKLLRKPNIKEELKRMMAEGRMTTEEIVTRIEGMVEGRIPTKVVETLSHTYGKPTYRREYDTHGAARDLGKVYALFVDKQIVENIGLEIVDDEESDSQDPPSTS